MKFQALFSLAASIIPLAHLGASEPVQFCKYGAENNEIDFCMSMLTHYNTSTSAHDLFLTMSVLRPNSTALGWTAIGLGEVMEGSLMFIVYGDPLVSKQPIVSIRKSTGHSQPTLITEEDTKSGADLRLLRADWQESPSDRRTVSAVVSVVCYSCHLFPGTTISATSKSQPWMWAWNDNQEFDDFLEDSQLQGHSHQSGAGGWGNFYVDMSRSLNTWKSSPSPPSIILGIQAIGVSESPNGSPAYGVAWLKNNPILHAHGILMGVAFLFVFPLGVLAMRSGRAKAFKYHWVLQLVASGLTVAGFVLGLVLGRKVDTFHQVLGITLVASLGVQGILGWRHHMVFLRLRRRTWLSHSHIYLGRLMMIGGWTNLITGLVLRGYSRVSVGIMGCVVVLEAIGLTAWLAWKRIKAARDERMNKHGSNGHKDDLSNYFALDDLDEDEEEDALPSGNPQDEESKPMMGKSEKA
ncbi:iron reductase domain protein [Annulohypoxylon moriforme]|nr:iron reductase domain protein [Annulohypoxylon moriforme]